MATWMRGLKLFSVLLGMLLLCGGNLAAQPSKAGAATDAESVKAILTNQTHWTVYWSRLGTAPRPPVSAMTGSMQITRNGDQIMGHISIPAFKER
jgi:hypothetical protein